MATKCYSCHTTINVLKNIFYLFLLCQSCCTLVICHLFLKPLIQHIAYCQRVAVFLCHVFTNFAAGGEKFVTYSNRLPNKSILAQGFKLFFGVNVVLFSQLLLAQLYGGVLPKTPETLNKSRNLFHEPNIQSMKYLLTHPRFMFLNQDQCQL